MSRCTQTLLGKDCLRAIKLGVKAIVDPVSRTFGHQGKNGLIYRTMNRGNRLTNDGKANAVAINPKNIFIRMAADFFKEACERTDQKVGDGTTATVIVAGSLYNEVSPKLEKQSAIVAKQTNSVMDTKREILKSADNVKGLVKKVAKKVKNLTELEKIATTSVEDEKLGKTIAKIAMDAGENSHIDVVEGYKGFIETDIMKGFRFPAKIVNKAFVTKPERYEMEAEDCHVIITDHKLDTVEIAPVLFELNKKISKVIIIAPDFGNKILHSIIEAWKTGYNVYPVKAPSLRTEQYEDLSIYCDAKFISKEKNELVSSIKFEDLGFLKKLVVKSSEISEDAVATGGRGTQDINLDPDLELKPGEQPRILNPIKERVKVLKEQQNETKHDQFKKLLGRRIASMDSAVGVIRVGASSDAEIYYQKLKIEDAVYACKAAMKGGYVKGGGLCLKEIADKLKDDDILKKSLQEPYRIIQTSMGGNEENPAKISEDIIDPADVIYYVVDHAASVVGNLLTVDIMTQELEEPLLGEPYFAIAKELRESNRISRKEKAILKENMDESYFDGQGGLADEELAILEVMKNG